MVLFINVMSSTYCAVVGGYNSMKKLKKWKESKFEIHGVLIKDWVCIYNPPYRLLKIFLWKGEKIEKSIEQLRQENKNKITSKPWYSNTIFSNHFVEGEPTVTHPLVEIKLDYEKQIPQPKMMIVKHLVPPKKAKKHNTEETVQTSPPLRTLSCQR